MAKDRAATWLQGKFKTSMKRNAMILLDSHINPDIVRQGEIQSGGGLGAMQSRDRL